MAQQLKKLVMYYSLEGNTALIAKAIAEAIDAEILELKPKKALNPRGFSRFFWGGKQVVMKEKPELLPFEKNPEEYNLIFLGTPVWAGNYNPAFRTFFSQVTLKNKHVALFCCCRGNKGNALKNLKQALTGNTILGEISFLDPSHKDPEKNIENAKAWAKNILSKLES